MPPQDKGEIIRDGHIIRIRKDIRAQHMRVFAVVLHKTTQERGHRDVTLDFSECESMIESCMLPLLPLFVLYRQQNVDFKFLPPENDDMARLFHNTNWAHFIEPKENDKSDFREKHVPAMQFFDSKSQTTAVDNIVQCVLGGLEEDRDYFKALEWALNEITDNVLSHAESEVGGFVQATIYKNSVEFVVADAGMGIPKSLRMERNKRAALREAIKPGGTKDKRSNAGNGLCGTYRLALKSEGVFTIDSDSAWLSHASQGTRIGKTPIPYNGTSIVCRIGMGNPDLLQEGLQFEGRWHNPAFDYMEKRFETGKAREMILTIKEHKQQLGSRAGGKFVHTLLKNMLREVEKGNAKHVVIDFADIGVISSSFADEVFGRLYVELGPFYQRWLQFQHTDSTIEYLIDRAIVQRWTADKEINGAKGDLP